MINHPLAKAIFWSSAALICLFLVLPSLVVIPMSFNGSETLRFPPSNLSLIWYRAYFGRPAWTDATLHSFEIAVSVTVLATTIGTLAALGLVRGRVPFRRLVTILLLAPIVVPTIVSAVGMYGMLAPIGLVGTIPGVVVAHTVLALPFVIINVSAVLQRMDRQIEQAARSLGASSLRTFWLVTLPMISTGIAAGAVFAFITSFDEVVVALFISGVDAATLPVQMWSGLLFEINPIVASVSTMLIALSLVAMLMFASLRRRSS